MKLIAFAVRVALISAVIVISSGTTSAITVQEIPGSRPQSWVTDSINILSPQTEAEINRLVDQLEARNSCEIMVVTVPETGGYSSPREFALAWFNLVRVDSPSLAARKSDCNPNLEFGSKTFSIPRSLAAGFLIGRSVKKA